MKPASLYQMQNILRNLEVILNQKLVQSTKSCYIMIEETNHSGSEITSAKNFQNLYHRNIDFLNF